MFSTNNLSTQRPPQFFESRYYPFGMAMPGRTYSSGTQYRYGFNGQEKSTEIGEGLTTAMFWEYDSRIGRRWNADPVLYAFISPYAVMANNPILLSDLLGNNPNKPGRDGKGEGESQTTSETSYGTLHNLPKTVAQEWIWHSGGFETGKKDKDGKDINTKAGWYTPEEYFDVLSSMSATRALAKKIDPSGWYRYGKSQDEQNALARFAYIYSGNEKVLGYTTAAAAHLNDAANRNAQGITYASGFNVEDMLGVGLLFKSAAKAIFTNFAEKLIMQTPRYYGLDIMVKVGHWGPAEEYTIMKATSKTVMEQGGYTFLSINGPESWAAAPKGWVYSEFFVKSKDLVGGGNWDWFKTLHPFPDHNERFYQFLINKGVTPNPNIMHLSEILFKK